MKTGKLPPPHIFGSHSRAWRMDIANALKNGCSTACLEGWVIHAPWCHPFFHGYHISLIHLREENTGQKATIYREGATHELALMVINPEWSAKLTDLKIPLLMPPNYVGQFICESDEDAKRKVLGVVHKICAAEVSPDIDFLRHWFDRFGDHFYKG